MLLEEIKDYTFLKNGIYAILNSLNNHSYVGSSNKIKICSDKRLRQLKNGIHHFTILQLEWNKYNHHFFEKYLLDDLKIKISIGLNNSITGDKTPDFSGTFLFYHKKYRQEKCSKVVLTNKYKLNYNKVCSICNRTKKTHSGWACIK